MFFSYYIYALLVNWTLVLVCTILPELAFASSTYQNWLLVQPLGHGPSQHALFNRLFCSSSQIIESQLYYHYYQLIHD
jgi:hypothetical protein